MKIGVCTSIDNAPLLAQHGYDYIELGMAGVCALDQAAFAELCAKADASPVPVEACNSFVPASVPLTGPAVDDAKTCAYLRLAAERAARLGVKVIVFGSGGARQIPEGFHRHAAQDQLARFLTLASDILGEVGVEVAIEPLRPAECNVINRVGDGLRLAQRVCRPNIGCLADLYHMAEQDEDMSGILAAGPMMKHCHIANPVGRVYPKAGDGSQGDYSAFFGALEAAGYDARISIEGGAGDLAADLADARAVFARYGK